MGYNIVADITGLFSFIQLLLTPNRWNYVKFREN